MLISKKIIMMLVLLIASVSLAADEEKEALARELIRITSMEALIATVPEQFKAQELHRRSDSGDPGIDPEVTGILIDALNPDKARNILYESVVENSTTERMREALSWFKSPLGSRFLIAEASLQDPGAEEEMMRFISAIHSNPPSNDRAMLISDFENASKHTDGLMRIYEFLMQGMMAGSMLAIPEEERLSEEEIQAQVSSMSRMLRKLMWQQMVMMAHYIYRDFTNDEIREYISFLKSRAGKEYVQLAPQAMAAVFQDLFDTAFPLIEESLVTLKKK